MFVKISLLEQDGSWSSSWLSATLTSWVTAWFKWVMTGSSNFLVVICDSLSKFGYSIVGHSSRSNELSGSCQSVFYFLETGKWAGRSMFSKVWGEEFSCIWVDCAGTWRFKGCFIALVLGPLFLPKYFLLEIVVLGFIYSVVIFESFSVAKLSDTS